LLKTLACKEALTTEPRGRLAPRVAIDSLPNRYSRVFAVVISCDTDAVQETSGKRPLTEYWTDERRLQAPLPGCCVGSRIVPSYWSIKEWRASGALTASPPTSALEVGPR
jgi:hypothetical protein